MSGHVGVIGPTFDLCFRLIDQKKDDRLGEIMFRSDSHIMKRY